jgi:hypothetical protein
MKERKLLFFFSRETIGNEKHLQKESSKFSSCEVFSGSFDFLICEISFMQAEIHLNLYNDLFPTTAEHLFMHSREKET